MQRWTAIALLIAAFAGGVARASEDDFHLGGAVRFNAGWLDYGAGKQDFDSELELLRVDSRGRRGRLSYALQYRVYQDFDALHHAWLGLDEVAGGQLRAGVQQVPFGLLPYASQSFWFGSGYYLGIEDDYDAGLVWERRSEPVDWQLGLFVADEYGDAGRFERYSFDVASTPALPYRERSRLLLRRAQRWQQGAANLEWGASAFAGEVENRVDGRRHGHYAAALHLQWQRGDWTLQGQWAGYRYAIPESRIALSAFAFPFEAASRAQVLSANIVRALPRPAWLDSFSCYNNLSSTRAVGAGRRDSWQNVSGCSFGRGPMFAYVDWIAGYNMWFIGGPGVGIDDPGGQRWRSRLNLNLGFYF